jgi:hypothetical protein
MKLCVCRYVWASRASAFDFSANATNMGDGPSNLKGVDHVAEYERPI